MTIKEPLDLPMISVNGQLRTVQAERDMPLLWALRDVLGLTGTKYGCGQALCGACTVLVDGEAVRSCVTPLRRVEGKEITTIEGLSASGESPLQRAWIELGVPQCGFCQAGQLMSAAALLKAIPQPTDADIDRAMAGNICRCGTYTRIRDAIRVAAGAKAGAEPEPSPAPQPKPPSKPATQMGALPTGRAHGEEG